MPGAEPCLCRPRPRDGAKAWPPLPDKTGNKSVSGRIRPRPLRKSGEPWEKQYWPVAAVPVELAELGQGTAAREAWRRFLHATIDPLGKLVAEELTEKFEFPVSLNFDSLMASDISGRARAFQSMVGGGIEITKAAALSGLMMTEDQ